MKTITKYVADDGSEWPDAGAARARDGLFYYVERAMRPLGDSPRGLRDAEYVQHSEENYRTAKSQLLGIIRATGDVPSLCGLSDDDVYLGAGAGLQRIYDGLCPIAKALSRFARISPTSYREYNQPYFAINEPKAE